MDLAGNVLAWSVLIIYFVGLPLYFKNGYDSIATNKYLFIMNVGKYVAIVTGVLFLIRMCLWGYSRAELAIYRGSVKTDIFMMSFLILAFISHLASPHRTGGEHYINDWFFEGSLYGTKGWYMGLMSYALFVLLYILISKALIYKRYVFIPIAFILTLECLWGSLNRYNIVPFDMNYEYSSTSMPFLASLGNINWFCGFTSVLVPLFWGVYLAASKWAHKAVLLFIIAVSAFMIFVNKSDSGIFAMAVTILVLLGYCLKDTEKIAGFTEMAMAICLSASVIPVCDRFIKTARENLDGILDFFYGIPALIFLVILAVVYFLWRFAKEKVKPETLVKVKKYYVIIVPAMFGLVILLIIINTLTGGALPVIGDKSFFMFDEVWGSGRKNTWGLGLETFKHMPFGRKLIGSGSDTFFYEMISYNDLHDIWNEIYKGARLTNAHNEWISLLVNNGVLGLVAFVGMLVTSVTAAFKNADRSPVLVSFALAVISYTANNMFSFEQVTNTPFLFLVLGLEAAVLADIYRPELKEAKTRKKENKKNKKRK